MYRKLRNISQAFILILALSYSFVGCKKRYEEGSLISFESPCKRIGQEWKLEYLFIDGIDSTSYMNAVSDSGYSFSAMNIPSKEGEYNPCGHNDLTIEVNYKSQGSSNIYGRKEISNSKKTIRINTGEIKQFQLRGIKPVGPFFTGEYLEFRIKRLTKTELWLDIEYKGKYCWVHFKS